MRPPRCPMATLLFAMGQPVRSLKSSHPQNKQPVPHPSPRSRPSALAPRLWPRGMGGRTARCPPPLPGGAWECEFAPPRSQSPPLPLLRCPPPLPGGALITDAIPYGRAAPTTHSPPLSPLAPVRPRPRLRFGRGRPDGSLPPPHSRGGLEITSSISFPHLYCMSDPDFGRLFAFSLTTIFPMPRYRFGIVKMHAREKVLRLRTPIHIMIH